MATPLLVVSPHLDDAVFSCGRAIAAAPGSVVVTVFSGEPVESGTMATAWDRHCGFADARAALTARKAEDRKALACLGAVPHWLGLLDSQYVDESHDGSGAEAIVDALRGALSQFPGRTVLAPLGLYHPDHRRVHEACVAALPASPAGIVCYEDALYRSRPGVLAARRHELEHGGWCLEAADLETGADVDAACVEAKHAAVRAYASQLAAFDPAEQADLDRPERYWRVMLRRPSLPAAERC